MTTQSSTPMLQSVSIMTQQPHHKQRTTKEEKLRGNAIAQIILGALSVIAGLSMLLLDKATFRGLNGNGYFGIPAMISGIWIVVTGVIGVVQRRKPISYCWNGIHMSFNIVAAFLAFGIVIALSIAISCLSDCEYTNYDYSSYNPYNDYEWYRHSNSTIQTTMNPPQKICSKYVGGMSLAGLLVFFNLIVFFVALSSVILCCFYSCCVTGGCCSKTGCCRTCCGTIAEKQRDYVTYQPQQMQQMYTTTSSAGNIIVSTPPTAYPISAPHYAPQSTVFYMVSQANYTQAGATNVAYSTEQPPQNHEKVSTDQTVISM